MRFVGNFVSFDTMRVTAVLFSSSLWLLSSAAPTLAEQGPQPAVPAPGWARSIEVINDGAPIMMKPQSGAQRRGTVGRGTRLAFARRVFGDGCAKEVWYETADGLFICEEHVVPSASPPGVSPEFAQEQGQRQHAFVRVDGTRAYKHPSDYFANDYFEAYGDGFGLVVIGRQVYAGMEFVQTRKLLWVERSALRFAQGSDFEGVRLAPGQSLDFAWVSPKASTLHSRPGGPAKRRLARRERVQIARVRGAWVELREGGFVRRSALALPELQPPPEGTGPSDRWVDVDLEQQLIVAYEGSKPRFATLVSTGKKLPATRTPKGVFPIWVKLARQDMDDIERTDVSRNYMIQEVPWVQFFKGAYGFHAAFWHDDFGVRRSHGCINLAPADARYLFHFTEPVLPAGWNAILALPSDRPTLVRVH